MSELSEMELIENLADQMKNCRETARALAHKRKDMRWFAVSQKFDNMRYKLLRLAVAGAPRGIILS